MSFLHSVALLKLLIMNGSMSDLLASKLSASVLGVLSLITLLICGWSAREFASGPPLHESLFHDPRQDLFALVMCLGSFAFLYSQTLPAIRAQMIRGTRLNISNEAPVSIDVSQNEDIVQQRLEQAIEKMRCLIQSSEDESRLWLVYDRLENDLERHVSRKVKLQPTKKN